MLHLHIVCPADITEAALERLCNDSGVANVVVVRGAAASIRGDLVEADVAREAADGVLAALCELGI
ncbi:MAG: DUF389 domain-containing protein, partial [Actinobacteria bacterium]|nr:DUF389 domain-containing protein [Actinomycetota bacterium]